MTRPVVTKQSLQVDCAIRGAASPSSASGRGYAAVPLSKSLPNGQRDQAVDAVSNLTDVASAPEHRYPVAVLVSGSGSNLQALIDAAADSGYAAEIAVVISDKAGVRGLERARAADIPSVVVQWGDHIDRASFTSAVCDIAEQHGAQALILAGFMRILAPSAIKRFPQRIINTHPALLPAFPGAHAIPEALAHGVKLSGVTIHFVDEEVDHGPIIYQEAVAVASGDTEANLLARVQEVEHRVYPEVVDAFARGQITVDGRSVVWEGR